MCDLAENYADIELEWHDDIPLAVDLVKMLYVDAPTGGPLHTFLDDENLDHDPRDLFMPEMHEPSVRGLAMAIGEIMYPMDERQRAEVLIQYRGQRDAAYREAKARQQLRRARIEGHRPGAG